MAYSAAAVGLRKVPVHISSAQNRLLLKNGRVVNDDGEFDADVYIDDGIIQQVGQNLVVPGGARSFDVRGQFVIPAGIDTSTQAVLKEHAETKTGAIFSLTRSAICGGTTLVFIELRRGHPSESLLFAFQRMLGVFSKESCCNFAVNVVVDHFDDPTARDLETLARDHGVASFQVDIASLPDEQLLQIFKLARRLGVLVRCVSDKEPIATNETNEQRCNEEANEAAVSRAIAVSTASLDATALLIGAVKSRKAAKQAAHARRQGLPVFADVQCNTLREQHDSLMNLVAVGDLACVCSGSCGLTDFQAAAERLCTVYQLGVQRGLLDMAAFVRATSADAARLHGLYPRRGRVAAGSLADLAVWNPRGNTCFSSQVGKVTLHGSVSLLVANGRLAFDGSDSLVYHGCGSFERCVPRSPFVFARLDAFDVWQRDVIKRSRNDAATKAALSPALRREQHVFENSKKSATVRSASAVRYAPIHRMETRSGVRNQQESSFSLSGAQIDDDEPFRPQIRTKQTRSQNPLW